MAKKEAAKDSLCWHFPDLQHADSEGLNDPLLQYFGGDYNWYIAREVIQNSIDAHDDTNDAPVVVKFEKLSMKTSDIPGLDELKEHLSVCLAQAKAEQNDRAERYYADAVRAASEPKTTVLRASDRNTTGLTGADRDKKGKWHRLVRAVGENQATGVGGGSYGIGKGAPFVASRLRAVYYSTKNEAGETIFQGKARLMSHELKGKEYRGVGSFGVKGYESVRDAKLIPPEFLREEQGTDINIIAYGAILAWADELATSVVKNFWMAIYSGLLEVVIVQGLSEIAINRETLRACLEKYSRDEALVYYRSVVEPTRVFEKPLPLLGSCRLFIRIEEKFPRKLAMMRRPKMTVDEWKFPKTLQEPFAGVFLCDNVEGNMILRGLEPPEHDKWDPKLDDGSGKEAVDEIRDWIRGNLMELAEEESGDPEEIPELEKFLPYDEDSDRVSESNKSRSKPSGLTSAEESGMEVGADRDEKLEEVEEFVSKPSSRIRDGGDGPSPGGQKSKGSSGGNGGGAGNDDGRGVARINTSAARFRVIYAGTAKSGMAEYCLIIEPAADIEGSLGIVAIGDDSAVYPVNLSSVEEWGSKGKELKHSGSFIEELKLKKSKAVRLRVTTKSGSRYALGVENYES